MGSNKAFLRAGGKMLIEHALRRLKPLQCDIFIVGPKSEFNPFGRVLEDTIADAGPLAGIQRALERSETEYNVITAVDTPLVPSSFLVSLAATARGDTAEVVIPQTQNGFQPLCAVYRKGFLEAVNGALAKGERKVDRVIFARPHRIISAEGDIFLNVNTPEDLVQADKLLLQARAAQP
jgi:molybdopterin-guanine dinucleotide biosynthesis protein A